MTIIQLEYLLAVANFGSFSIASEHCFVTQPSLSMQIKSLEEELGVILLDRSKKPVIPTEAGALVIAQAQETLKAYDESLNAATGDDMRWDTTAGAEYCRHLDNSIVRGFNPYLTYEVDQTLQTAPFCIHRMKDVDFDADTDLKKKPENLRSFEYHCAHSYWSYREVCTAIFGKEGQDVARRVLEDVCRDYGQDMTDVLLSYETVNFNVCD